MVYRSMLWIAALMVLLALSWDFTTFAPGHYCYIFRDAILYGSVAMVLTLVAVIRSREWTVRGAGLFLVVVEVLAIYCAAGRFMVEG